MLRACDKFIPFHRKDFYLKNPSFSFECVVIALCYVLHTEWTSITIWDFLPSFTFDDSNDFTFHAFHMKAVKICPGLLHLLSSTIFSRSAAQPIPIDPVSKRSVCTPSHLDTPLSAAFAVNLLKRQRYASAFKSHYNCTRSAICKAYFVRCLAWSDMSLQINLRDYCAIEKCPYIS